MKEPFETKAKHRYSRDTSRLSPDDIKTIRKRREAGESFESIAKDYQFVKEVTIRQVIWNQKYYGKK